MPVPVYIICCESGSEDSFTGLASLFNVIDRIVVRPAASEEKGNSEHRAHGATSLRIVSVWMGEEAGDFESEFETEIRITLLPHGDEAVLYSEPFRLSPEKRRHRTTVILNRAYFKETGTLVIESRVRRIGETEWITQRYTVDIHFKLGDDMTSSEGSG
jgi:hypothetical protein